MTWNLPREYRIIRSLTLLEMFFFYLWLVIYLPYFTQKRYKFIFFNIFFRTKLSMNFDEHVFKSSPSTRYFIKFKYNVTQINNTVVAKLKMNKKKRHLWHTYRKKHRLYVLLCSIMLSTRINPKGLDIAQIQHKTLEQQRVPCTRDLRWMPKMVT